MEKDNPKITLFAAISFVVANMIGTGVFTSLGFQLMGINDVFSILLLWLIGGVIAITGADVYGELGASMPRSGGEYHYLSKIYHPFVGYLSGFVSAFVGFAAPIALASMALAVYSKGVFPFINPLNLATIVIIILTLIHSTTIKTGVRFQNLFTILKIILIVIFIFSGFYFTESPQDISIMPTQNSLPQITSGAFFVSLVYVYYSFSGWNASAYIVGELKNPSKILPKSLLFGSLVVTVLYLLLNFIFMYTAPVNELKGTLDVGFVASNYIFGNDGGKIMGMLISLLLISSISSMIFVGPRVILTIGEDFKSLNFFSKKKKNGIPVVAIISQTIISLILLWTSSFDTLLTYLGFLMSLFALLTVSGVFIHRIKFKTDKRPYKAFGYYISPVIFSIFTLWTMIFLVIERPMEILYAVITLLIGFILYLISRRSQIKHTAK